MNNYYAVIEAGGTKFNCAVIDEHKQFLARSRIPTTNPNETLALVSDFFEQARRPNQPYTALGIASFGPIDMSPSSPTFGYITSTPKPGWSNTDMVVPLAKQLKCPVAFDTDVNGAAYAESLWGAGKGKEVVIYITVGTGVGGGVVINGRPVHGLIHPEMGHMLIPGHPAIQGVCPFHTNCVEGLASGAALSKIWQQPAEQLEDEHQAWDVQSTILSQLCHNLLTSFSPQKIILGGGVMAKPGLIEAVIEKTQISLNHYLTLPHSVQLQDVISPTGLNQDSGLLGALALAQTQAIELPNERKTQNGDT